MPEATIWIDFENTPHVLFLEPFARWAESCGFRLLLTAKPQSQTIELARVRGLDVCVSGIGDLETAVGKRYEGIKRTLKLASLVQGKLRPLLLLSSSRTASIAAMLTGVPALGIMDYEHSSHWPLALACREVWMPDLLVDAELPSRTHKAARFFPGLKENLYLDGWPIDRQRERERLDVSEEDFLVVARPPAESAHYQSSRSMTLWLAAVRHLHDEAKCHVVVLARSASQREGLQETLGRYCRVRVLGSTVPGPDTVGAADLVLGGGGTMNREAAVLGVPVWSVFCGPAPHIDDCLAREGRLLWVRSQGELSAAMRSIDKRRGARRGPFPEAIAMITQQMESILGEGVAPH